MRRVLLIVILLSIIPNFGGAGFYQDVGANQYQKILFDFGNGDEWKRLDTEIDGVDYQTKQTTDTWILKGGEAFLFVDGGDGINNVYCNYRIYKDGTTPPGFTQIEYNNSDFIGGNNYRFYNTVQNINILDQNTITSGGKWFVEFYYEASTSDGAKFWGNGGANYILFFTADAAFPVELTSFTSSIIDRNVNLIWETATEVDNYGFEIERVKNSSHASTTLSMTEGSVIPSGVEGWKTISFIAGAGNSNSPKAYSFTDKEILGNGTYSYRLKQIDTDGKFEYSNIINVKIDTPAEFMLEQNYPNPFNPETTIKFSVAESGFANLRIYNGLGEQVSELFNRPAEAGRLYEVNFNASDLSSGVYYYKLTSNNFSSVRKMLLVK